MGPLDLWSEVHITHGNAELQSYNKICTAILQVQSDAVVTGEELHIIGFNQFSLKLIHQYAPHQVVRQPSFTVGSHGFLASYVPLLGLIASGPVHLKRNKGLGGTCTPFSSSLKGTPPVHHTSSPFLTLAKTKH